MRLYFGFIRNCSGNSCDAKNLIPLSGLPIKLPNLENDRANSRAFPTIGRLPTLLVTRGLSST